MKRGAQMGAFLLGVFGADVEAELEELEVELVGVHKMNTVDSSSPSSQDVTEAVIDEDDFSSVDVQLF